MAFKLNPENFSTSFIHFFLWLCTVVTYAWGSLELAALHVYFICIQLIATDCRVSTVWVRDRKPPWSFEKHISTRKKTEPRKRSKREESLIWNHAQRIKERLNRDTGNWKSNIWERRRDWAFYTVNKIIWK